MIYTKDTFKPEHIGRKVRWTRQEGMPMFYGKGKGILNRVTKDDCLAIAVLADEERLNREGDNGLHWVSSYELIDEFPMPLKEAYDRGLLRVGQKIKLSHPCREGYEKSIWIIEKVNTIEVHLSKLSGEVGYNDDFTYDYGWSVDILEEPKEEETSFYSKSYPTACKEVSRKEEEKGEDPWKYNPRMHYGIDLGLRDYSFMTIHSPINQPTKPTIMSYLSKARQAVKDLVTPEDVKILREAGWETEPHVRSQEGTEALLDLLYAEKREELVKKAKDIKNELDAEKE